MKVEHAVYVLARVPSSVAGSDADIEAGTVVKDPAHAHRIVSAGLPHRLMTGTPLDGEPFDPEVKPKETAPAPDHDVWADAPENPVAAHDAEPKES